MSKRVLKIESNNFYVVYFIINTVLNRLYIT